MWQAIVNRQEGFLNFTPQNHRAFKQTRVAVFGAGGNGVVMENLLRMGFERFEILDPDVVDDTNLNRLPFTCHHIGRPKVEAWRDFLLDVNPGCTVRIHRHKVTCRDAGLVEDIVDRADLIFLQTTSAEANLVIARACAAKGRRMIVGKGTRIVKMPVIQVFDPFKGAAYYYNLLERRIGIPDWLTGEITWQAYRE